MFVCLFGVSLFALCTRYALSVRKLYFRELSKGNKCNCREIDSLINVIVVRLKHLSARLSFFDLGVPFFSIIFINKNDDEVN